jgi:triosephosphate isomerase
LKIVYQENFMTRERFVMGNWKMNGSTATLQPLLEEIRSLQLPERATAVVFPPFVYIGKTARAFEHSALKFGAQDVSEFDKGAYTGEISAAMLKDMGCEYVLVGHSERRQHFGETAEHLLQKCIQAAKAGLRPVLCVGETLEEYNLQQTEQKVLVQLESVLKSPALLPYLNLIIIAYEPVWAIGTGLTATPQQAQKVHRFIRQTIAELDETLASTLPVLYGGSVKSSNAKQLFAMTDIDGALVGGASLIGEEFCSICQALE